jgi:hypothetical protein
MAENLKFNEQGQTVIPDGYRWCNNCEALTPHRDHNVFSGDYICEVCGSTNYSPSCPKCGCDESEDFCEPKMVIRHHKGCHDIIEDDDEGYSLYSYSGVLFRDFEYDFMKKCPNRGSYTLPRDQDWYDKNQRLKRMLKEYKERTKCQCPRFVIYQDINQIVTDGGSYYAGETVHWFEYKVRCRICGHIYENGDST